MIVLLLIGWVFTFAYLILLIRGWSRLRATPLLMVAFVFFTGSDYTAGRMVFLAVDLFVLVWIAGLWVWELRMAEAAGGKGTIRATKDDFR